MNENELRRALAGHAATIAPAADPGRLEAGLARADRLRTIRTACASAAVGAVAVFGLMSISGEAESTTVDVVDSPTIDPVPDGATPLVGDSDRDESDGADGALAAADSTTTSTPTQTDGRPDHLTSRPPAAAEEPSSTSAPPTTTATPPPTTATPPTTTAAPPTTTVQAAVVFSAAPRYGSCAEEPPYDEYSGTAPPGSTVSISSPYSSVAQTTADGEGNWFLRVEFVAAPANEYFNVDVTHGSETKTFSFIHTV